jgi:hypothetical protein
MYPHIRVTEYDTNNAPPPFLSHATMSKMITLVGVVDDLYNAEHIVITHLKNRCGSKIQLHYTEALIHTFEIDNMFQHINLLETY